VIRSVAIVKEEKGAFEVISSCLDSLNKISNAYLGLKFEYLEFKDVYFF